VKIIIAGLLLVLSLYANADEDSDAFRALYEKEWAFRLDEYPSLSRENGINEKAHLIPFNSDWGFYLSWNRWGESTDFNSIEDYRNYVSRLKLLPVVMDEYIYAGKPRAS
jgi:uncharacterized protein (DUF885 family)